MKKRPFLILICVLLMIVLPVALLSACGAKVRSISDLKADIAKAAPQGYGTAAVFKSAPVAVGSRIATYRRELYADYADGEYIRPYIGRPYHLNAVWIEDRSWYDGDPDIEGSNAHFISDYELHSCNWYYFAEQDDLRTLIREDEDGTLSLWEFYSLGSGRLSFVYPNDNPFYIEVGEKMQQMYDEAFPDATNTYESSEDTVQRLIDGKRPKTKLKYSAALFYQADSYWHYDNAPGLSVNVVRATEEWIKFDITNETETPMLFEFVSRPFSLLGGTWFRVDPRKEVATPAIGTEPDVDWIEEHTLRPGDTKEFTVSWAELYQGEPLPAGDYRMPVDLKVLEEDLEYQNPTIQSVWFDFTIIGQAAAQAEP